VALVEALEHFPHKRRTAIYSTAGDRRDCDMIRQGELLGEAFDRVIIYEDHYTRGRQPGEITRLIRQGLDAGERVTEIRDIRSSVEAIRYALQNLMPGELLLVQADEIEETIEFLKGYLSKGAVGREVQLKDLLEMRNTEPAYML
jgi:cyanophycin synthetase